MRLLCDQNAAQKYVDACISASDIQAVTVQDALDLRVSDWDIAACAKTNKYVVLTGDDDFFQLADQFGCIYFHLLYDSQFGFVVERHQTISLIRPSASLNQSRRSVLVERSRPLSDCATSSWTCSVSPTSTVPLVSAE